MSGSSLDQAAPRLSVGGWEDTSDLRPLEEPLITDFIKNLGRSFDRSLLKSAMRSCFHVTLDNFAMKEKSYNMPKVSRRVFMKYDTC